MNRPRYFFTLGELAGTPLTRYAIVAEDGHTVLGVQVSVPDDDLMHIERPTHLRWRQAADVSVKTKIDYQQFAIGNHNGEQPRRPVWKRAGRTAAPEVVT